jgi:hypothetical protein
MTRVFLSLILVFIFGLNGVIYADENPGEKPIEIIKPSIDPLNITDSKIHGKDPLDWLWGKVLDLQLWCKKLVERILPILPTLYGVVLIVGTILGLVISKKIIKWVLLTEICSLVGIILILNGYDWMQSFIKWLST